MEDRTSLTWMWMKKSTNPSPVHGKHIPLRTCAACRQIKAKGELIRMVRTANGNIEIDSSGRKPGRGTYLCRDAKCWESGLKNDRVGYILKTSPTRDNLELLFKEAEGLLKGVD